MKIDPAITAAVEESGLPFTYEQGKRHVKLKLEGRLVTILSRNPKGKGRIVKNIVAQIKREGACK